MFALNISILIISIVLIKLNYHITFLEKFNKHLSFFSKIMWDLIRFILNKLYKSDYILFKANYDPLLLTKKEKDYVLKNNINYNKRKIFQTIKFLHIVLFPFDIFNSLYVLIGVVIYSLFAIWIFNVLSIIKIFKKRLVINIGWLQLIKSFLIAIAWILLTGVGYIYLKILQLLIIALYFATKEYDIIYSWCYNKNEFRWYYNAHFFGKIQYISVIIDNSLGILLIDKNCDIIHVIEYEI